MCRVYLGDPVHRQTTLQFTTSPFRCGSNILIISIPGTKHLFALGCFSRFAHAEYRLLNRLFHVEIQYHRT